MTTFGPNREAERLRIILMSFADVQPNMTLHEAVPAIFETEKKTAALESVETRGAGFELPDISPATIGAFIDLSTDIQDMITGGKKIHAIKEVRTRCTYDGMPVGLKESKDGVEWWERFRTVAPTPPVTSSSASAIVDWIDEPGQEDIRALITSGARIVAIKEVRHRYPPGAGLREAKDGVIEWGSRRGIS